LFVTCIQIENNETRDDMEYGGPPLTEFQKFIRLSQSGNMLLYALMFFHYRIFCAFFFTTYILEVIVSMESEHFRLNNHEFDIYYPSTFS